MRSLLKSKPLKAAELDKLQEFLERRHGTGMNIEELDGFFSALLAGPDIMRPSEYMPLVFGGTEDDEPEFEDADEAEEMFSLIFRHWNSIAEAFGRDDVHWPIIIEDKDGKAYGNDWAKGFMRGTQLHEGSWNSLLNDDNHAGCMVPVFMLFHEHDEDPSLRPPEITDERRNELIGLMAAGALLAHRYFNPRAQSEPETKDTSRNSLCPCGSGKKYKRCCGAKK